MRRDVHPTAADGSDSEFMVVDQLVRRGLDNPRVLAAMRDVPREAFVNPADRRRAYGETRMIALGPIQGRAHVLVYTRRGAHIRVISLRKANDREVQLYAGSTKQEDHDG